MDYGGRRAARAVQIRFWMAAEAFGTISICVLWWLLTFCGRTIWFHSDWNYWRTWSIFNPLLFISFLFYFHSDIVRLWHCPMATLSRCLVHVNLSRRLKTLSSRFVDHSSFPSFFHHFFFLYRYASNTLLLISVHSCDQVTKRSIIEKVDPMDSWAKSGKEGFWLVSVYDATESLKYWTKPHDDASSTSSLDVPARQK